MCTGGDCIVLFPPLRIFVNRHDTAQVKEAVRLFAQWSGAWRFGSKAIADGRVGTDDFSDI